MEHLPQIVIDLALLLTAAALATIVCKRFKQPLILGYVLAGFLVSPAIGWLPNIVDTENIQIWSELGVIFLMFGLGLEFSIIRLTTVGKPAIITALTEMALMIGAGILCGTLLGWSFLTSLFLGGMLAISSTTIIIKTFDELNLKNKKFTELVFGSLVIEDIIGIFLMVFLSTIAVRNTVDGGTISLEIGRMALYLIIWFVLSVIIVPTLLRKVANVITDEILLISSVALCLLMVVLANVIGFSAALGAFMAGSILAGTIRAHRIEDLFRPIKDFFGAIFFVSVGMLVSPQMIVDNIIPILIISLVTLICKPVFTLLGALFSKQSLKTSVETGLSLSQIGEFSFIIAALGVSLGVTADFLYPVIVAVSIVTTLTTPFYVKNTDKVYNLLIKIVPQPLLDFIENRAENTVEEKGGSSWTNYLKQLLIKILMVVFAGLASVELLSKLLSPLLLTFMSEIVADLFVTGVALIITGVFIANLFHGTRKGRFGILWMENRKNRIPLILLLLFSIIISSGTVLFVIFVLENVYSAWLIIPALLVTLLLARSRTLHSGFLKIETYFIGNLNEGLFAEERAALDESDQEEWIKNQLSIVKVEASDTRTRKGGIISVEFLMAHSCNLSLVAIERNGVLSAGTTLSRTGKRGLFAQATGPLDHNLIEPGDILTFLGTNEEVDIFLEDAMDVEKSGSRIMQRLTFAEYESQGDLQALDARCLAISVDSSFDLRGKTIASSGLSTEYGCLVLAIEHESRTVLKPNHNTRLSQGDRVWLLCPRVSEDMLQSRKGADVLDEGPITDQVAL